MISISTVSAIDNNSSNSNSSTTINLYNSVNDSTSNNQNYLESSKSKSFSDLQNLIDSNKNGTIDLDSDYSFSDGDNKYGISIINKTITINGNNHIINAKNNNIIFNLSSSTLKLNNINFVGGYSTEDTRTTGLIDSTKSNITCINSRFSNIEGRVFNVEYSNLTIKKSKFTNIHPDDKYDAYFNGLISSSFHSNVSVSDSNFDNIYGGGFSGSFISFIDNSFKINNCNFTKCSSSGSGGVLYFALDNANVSNCNFINCSSSSSGGSIFSNKANVIINNSKFDNNYISSDKKYFAGKGGACHFQDSNVTIINSKFNNNSANVGGSILFQKYQYKICNINIINSSFINDKAIYGGSLASLDDCYANIINSKFINEHSIFGGAISYATGNLTINNSEFNKCSASKFGGAIVSNSNMTIANSKFKNNNALLGKDIAEFNSSSLNVKNSTFNNYYFENLVHNIKNTYVNTSMNDSSISFCSEYVIYPPVNGSEYFVYDTDILYNKVNDKSVNEYLKILIYQFYYKSNYNSTELQYAIWTFTDTKFWDLDNLNLTDNVKYMVSKTIDLYNSGFRVPDYGATDILDNGSVRIYQFNALFNQGIQNLLNFKVFYNDTILPNITVHKETLNKTVILGNQTSFNIIVKNTGNLMLNDVIVFEDKYDGLIYNNWESVKGVWKFINGNKPSWVLKNLGVNQTAIIKVTFNTTKVGNFTNIVVVKSNETNNKTTNNTTNVIPPENNTPKNNTPNNPHTPDNTSSFNDATVKKLVTTPITGNPITIVLLALSSLALIPIKRKK